MPCSVSYSLRDIPNVQGISEDHTRNSIFENLYVQHTCNRRTEYSFSEIQQMVLHMTDNLTDTGTTAFLDLCPRYSRC